MNEWRNDKLRNKSGRACPVCAIWQDYNDGMPLKIATVHKNGQRIPTSEYEANVRLITAAPKMLALLTELCKDKAITKAATEAFKARDEARELLAAINGA